MSGGRTATPRLVLASASPRRAELLDRVGYRFTVDPADADETIVGGEDPSDFVARVAADKARTVAARHPHAAVLAADTAVVLDGRALGKPTDPADAMRMLTDLSGREHQVMSAVHLCIATGAERSFTAVARVRFGPCDPGMLAGYVAGGEPMDKAGAYGLQGVGAALVTRVEGDPTTVVGLPLHDTVELLRSVGLPPPAFGP
jgi:septum formation protein